MTDTTADPQEPGVVVGYKQRQPQASIDAVNHTKTLENELGDWITQLRASDQVDVDEEWAKVAVRHLQAGFMALNRAVFQPESRLR